MKTFAGWQTGAMVAVAGIGGALIGGAMSAGPAQSQDSVQARLQRLEDLQAIEYLMVAEYPLALDGRNWKAYANTFTVDGELVQGTTVNKGRDKIEAAFSTPRPRPAAPAPAAAPTGGAAAGATPATAAPREAPIASKHVITNVKITLKDANTAEATAYWQTVSTRGRTTTVAGAGHYVDRLRKENGQWKFSHREIVNPLRDANATRTTAAN